MHQAIDEILMFSSRFGLFPVLIAFYCRAKIVFIGRNWLIFMFLILLFQFTDLFIRRLSWLLIGQCGLTASGFKRLLSIKIKFNLSKFIHIRRRTNLKIVA